MTQAAKNMIGNEKIYSDHLKNAGRMVMDGYEQALAGKTKSFNAVCERLEKKYGDEEI